MRVSAIVVRLLLITAVIAAAGGAYIARDAIGGTQATFSSGNVDLLVDSRGFYNGASIPKLTWGAKDLKPYADKFFKFLDVKPGDFGRSIVSLHIKKAPAWVCLSFEDFEEKENGRNEPEKLVDGSGGSSSGELGKGIEFFAWYDDGDTIFEVGEKPLFGTSTQSGTKVIKGKTYALADWKHGPAWAKDSKHYVGIAWCAGNLSVNTSTAVIACDGATLGNEAQTDSLSFSVLLEAVPQTQEKKYVCGGNDGHDDYDKPDPHDYIWNYWGDEHGESGECRIGRRD